MALVQFTNCTVLRRGSIKPADVWVYDGKVVKGGGNKIPDNKIDCDGRLIAPGLIDLQINGAFGEDFTSGLGNPESAEQLITKVGLGLLSHGVTGYCPTIVTSPSSVYKQLLPLLHRREGGPKGAALLGVHLEGPLLSRARRGAHREEHLKLEASSGGLADLYGEVCLENVSIITLAPELPGALEVVEEATAKGIVVSVGHTEAGIDLGQKAVAKGATMVTHLFNAMEPFHHREPGLLGLLLREDKLWFGMIVDGVHTCPEAVKLAYRVSPKRLVLVTDAIAGLGLKEGDSFKSGQQEAQVKGGRAVVSGTNTLIGSVATLLSSVQRLVEQSGCAKAEALEAASLRPATILGLEAQKGSLEVGCDADFVMLEPSSLQLVSTWVAGVKVFPQ